jgi:uncharacterized protein YjbI with pentapeptide repeats
MPPAAKGPPQPKDPKQVKDDTPAAPRLPEQLEDVAAGASTRGDLDWAAARASGDFSGRQRDGFDCVESHVLGATFTASEFVPVRLSDSIFDDCELSGVVLQEASLSRVVFNNCRMSGIVLAGARLRDVVFNSCKLDEVNLRGTVGERLRFEGCVMTKADLSGARYTGSRIVDCDLTQAEFAAVQLRGTRLHGSQLEGVRGAESLKGVIIGSGQLIPLAQRLFQSLGITIDDDL